MNFETEIVSKIILCFCDANHKPIGFIGQAIVVVSEIGMKSSAAQMKDSLETLPRLDSLSQLELNLSNSIAFFSKN